MTELQKCQLDLLKIVLKICEKYDLMYYLVCGSALGAAKYNGYIPWDDDIDVGLPRKDYEAFCKYAQQDLPEYCFLQNAHTEKNFPFVYSKLRNSQTTFIEKAVSKNNINHGVYIDIFPLDDYCINPKKQRKFERRKKIYNLLTLSCLSVPFTGRLKLFVGFERLLGINKKPNQLALSMENYIIKTGESNSNFLCNHGNWQGKFEYAPKEQYAEGIFTIFEGLSVRIPKNYDAYLTQKYGDWRADLPKEKQKSHHNCEICDIERPYTYYIEIISKNKIELKNKY